MTHTRAPSFSSPHPHTLLLWQSCTLLLTSSSLPAAFLHLFSKNRTSLVEKEEEEKEKNDLHPYQDSVQRSCSLWTLSDSISPANPCQEKSAIYTFVRSVVPYCTHMTDCDAHHTEVSRYILKLPWTENSCVLLHDFPGSAAASTLWAFGKGWEERRDVEVEK